jgi:hemerythrin-like domain-containing protein
MRQNTPLATDHQLMRESLEVLRLIGDRVEVGELVEPGDLTTVLGFLRDVCCECLQKTEEHLLRPALQRAKQEEQIQRFRLALTRRSMVRPLLETTLADTKHTETFVPNSRRLTLLVTDLIFEEDCSLLQEAMDLLNDAEGRRSVESFAEHERHIRSIAVSGSATLHRLETKYAHPHCI